MKVSGSPRPAPTVLVLGAGDVGSAVAHRLFRHGARVLLCDLPKPAHSRRGMAFTDAMFDGSAALEGVVARHAASLQAVQETWQGAEAIPIVALPEAALAAALRFDAAVDAIMRRQLPPQDRRAMAPFAIGLGPGFVPGSNCHVAVETQWGAAMGDVLRDRAPAALSGGPRLLDGIGRERFVVAAASGTWRTSASIGSVVASGEIIGTIGETPMRAPSSGGLRGLTRDGVKVAAGQPIIEIDPREPPQVFGLGERPLAIARGVCRALDLE